MPSLKEDREEWKIGVTPVPPNLDVPDRFKPLAEAVASLSTEIMHAVREEGKPLPEMDGPESKSINIEFRTYGSELQGVGKNVGARYILLEKRRFGHRETNEEESRRIRTDGTAFAKWRNEWIEERNAGYSVMYFPPEGSDRVAKDFELGPTVLAIHSLSEYVYPPQPREKYRPLRGGEIIYGGVSPHEMDPEKIEIYTSTIRQLAEDIKNALEYKKRERETNRESGLLETRLKLKKYLEV